MLESDLFKSFKEMIRKNELIDREEKNICKICGSTDITFEHVPPKSVGNNNEFRKYDSLELVTKYNRVEDIIFENHKYEQHQKGTGGFFLCNFCNNRTGELYVKAYKKFHYVISNYLKNNLCELNNEKFEIVVETNMREYVYFAKQCILMEYISNNAPQMPVELKEWIMDAEDYSLDINVFVDLHIINPYEISFSYISTGKFVKAQDKGRASIFSTLLVSPFIIDAYDCNEDLENNILKPRFVEHKEKTYVIFTSKNYNGLVPGMGSISKQEIDDNIARSIE